MWVAIATRFADNLVGMPNPIGLREIGARLFSPSIDFDQNVAGSETAS